MWVPLFSSLSYEFPVISLKTGLNQTGPKYLSNIFSQLLYFNTFRPKKCDKPNEKHENLLPQCHEPTDVMSHFFYKEKKNTFPQIRELILSLFITPSNSNFKLQTKTKNKQKKSTTTYVLHLI